VFPRVASFSENNIEHHANTNKYHHFGKICPLHEGNMLEFEAQMVMKHSHAQLKVTHELIYPRFQSGHLKWRFHLTGFTTSNVNGVTQTNAVMIAE